MSFTVDSDGAYDPMLPNEKAYLTSAGDFGITGKLSASAFQMETGAAAGRQLITDEFGNGTWQTPSSMVTADRLTIPSTTGKSIVLGYSDADPASAAFNGFGISVAAMKYMTASNTVSHAFYRANGTSGTPVELMTIGGTGTVSIPATSNLNVAGATTLASLQVNDWVYCPGVRSESDVAARNLTPATIGAPSQPSPNLNLLGSFYNSTTGNKIASYTMNIDPVTVNADPIETKLSFKATNDSVSVAKTEMASLTSGGKLNLSGGLLLPTTGGTPSLLNHYEEYDHVTTFTGPNTSPSLTLKITRIGRQVHCLLPSHWAPSTVSTAFFMAVPFPARFRHNMSPLVVPLIVTHAGVYTSSMGLFSADGTVQICATPPNGSFPVSGHSQGAGWHTSTISWTI
jgi:hypothetical protein